jgi:nucleotide-binding universal stress UspA family protein
MLPIRTILYPTDFSARSEYAFPLACSLARDHDARLLVMHVVPPPQAVGYDEMPLPPPLSPEYNEQMAANLRRLQPPDPALRVEYRLEEGFAATEILRLAEEAKADLVVMGMHGRTGLSRLVLGSVAEHVVRKARCSVLTVKAPFPGVESGLPVEQAAALSSTEDPGQ